LFIVKKRRRPKPPGSAGLSAATPLAVAFALVVATTRTFARFACKLVVSFRSLAAAPLAVAFALVVATARTFARFARDNRAVGRGKACVGEADERCAENCGCEYEFDACHELLL
jgi:hypothetical protein